MTDRIRPLEPGHLLEVAKIHSRAFPTAVLTQLGTEAVRRYYEWQLLPAHRRLCVGYFVEPSLWGYAFAGGGGGAVSGFVRRNKWFLLFRLLARPDLIFSGRARAAVRLGFSLLHPAKRQRPSQPSLVSSGPSFGILAIAVDPSYQGKRIGGQLMDYCEVVARQHKCARMHLSVRPDNLQAVRFYENLGWVKESSKTPWSGFMEKMLS